MRVYAQATCTACGRMAEKKKFKFKSKFELRMGSGLFPAFCHPSLSRVGGRKCECKGGSRGKSKNNQGIGSFFLPISTIHHPLSTRPIRTLFPVFCHPSPITSSGQNTSLSYLTCPLTGMMRIFGTPPTIVKICRAPCNLPDGAESLTFSQTTTDVLDTVFTS